MEQIILGEKMKTSEIHSLNKKCSIVCINDDGKILLCNFSNLFILPGGNILSKDNFTDAMIRTFKEKTNETLPKEELDLFLKLDYYQKKYPLKYGEKYNRHLTIYSFIIEKNFYLAKNSNLEWYYYDQIPNLLEHNTNANPRQVFFDLEVLTTLKAADRYSMEKNGQGFKRVKY